MNLNLLARIAKLVALFGFVLPWVIVSCSGNELASATGLQLMTGDIQPNPDLARMSEGGQSRADADPNPYVIAAFAIIALGLLGSLILRAKAAAGLMLATALLGLGLSYYSVKNVRDGLAHETAQRGEQARDGAPAFLSDDQRDDLSRAITGAVRVEPQEGYWLTLIALAIAAALAAGTLSVSASSPNNRNPE